MRGKRDRGGLNAVMAFPLSSVRITQSVAPVIRGAFWKNASRPNVAVS